MKSVNNFVKWFTQSTTELIDRNEKKILLFILVVFSVLFFLICYFAEGTFDTGDGLEHYFISRYSWKHPALLMYLWGKPVFTLFSSVFSQFGLPGMSVFQILCAALSSFFCWKTAKISGFKNAWIIPVFIFFAPVYFPVINTGLTEPMFGCVLSFVIWQATEKKYGIASLLASFLPFIRSEAYVILPLIAMLFLVRRKYLQILLLFTGTALYTIIGYFVHGDILWLVHQHQSFRENYAGGKGEFFHYILQQNEIWGTAIFVLILLGLFAFVLQVVIGRKLSSGLYLEELFLIYGSFFAILTLHTLMYFLPGIITNLGMTRYMVTLIPVSSLIALRGLNTVSLLKDDRLFFIISLLMAVIVLINPFTRWYFPFRMGEEEKIMKKAGEFLKPDYGRDSVKIYYAHPYLPLPLNADPFDSNFLGRFSDLNKEKPEDSVKPGSIIVWDSHYSPQEGRMPLQKLYSNAYFLPVKRFISAKKFTNPNAFEVHIFKRVKDSLPALATEGGMAYDTIYFKIIDFEHDAQTCGTYLTSDNPHSGRYCLKIDSGKEFIKLICDSFFIAPQPCNFLIAKLQFWCNGIEKINDVHMVLELKRHNINIFWSSKEINIDETQVNKWKLFEAEFPFNFEMLKDEFNMNVYVWNKAGRELFLDDVSAYFMKCKDTSSVILW